MIGVAERRQLFGLILNFVSWSRIKALRWRIQQGAMNNQSTHIRLTGVNRWGRDEQNETESFCKWIENTIDVVADRLETHMMHIFG